MTSDRVESTHFFDLSEGFAVLRYACESDTGSLAAVETARAQLGAAIEMSGLTNGVNQFDAQISGPHGARLASLQLTILVEP